MNGPKPVLWIALSVLVAATSGTAVRAQDGGGFPRRVVDDAGLTVTVSARPVVVALAGDVPALAQVVAPDERRRIDPTSSAAADWQDVGLLVLPDLYATAYPALLEAAVSRDLPVFRVGSVASLDAWRSLVDRLGSATGRDDRAAAALRRLDRRLAWVQAAVEDEAVVRVLVLTPEGYTVGQGALLTELIAAAGGINAAAAAGYADFRQIDDAAIRALAPAVILLSPAWDADSAAVFAANPVYAGVPAVRDGRVFRLPFSPTLPSDPGTAVVVLALLLP